jgi:hypothetical protein
VLENSKKSIGQELGDSGWRAKVDGKVIQMIPQVKAKGTGFLGVISLVLW